MSPRAKKNLVAGLLVALSLWPVAHVFLVTRYEIDPWEFMGWGMYSMPSPQVHVRMEQLIDGHGYVVRPSDATLERLDAFSAARTRFGRFARVEELGAEVLELEPQMEGIVVILRRWELDRETAHFDYRETKHSFLAER